MWLFLSVTVNKKGKSPLCFTYGAIYFEIYYVDYTLGTDQGNLTWYYHYFLLDSLILYVMFILADEYSIAIYLADGDHVLYNITVSQHLLTI